MVVVVMVTLVSVAAETVLWKSWHPKAELPQRRYLVDHYPLSVPQILEFLSMEHDQRGAAHDEKISCLYFNQAQKQITRTATIGMPARAALVAALAVIPGPLEGSYDR